jgi:hypothetical protein
MGIKRSSLLIAVGPKDLENGNFALQEEIHCQQKK